MLSFKNLTIWIFSFFQKSDKIWARKFAMEKSKLYKPKIIFFNLTKIPQWKLKPLLPACLPACVGSNLRQRQTLGFSKGLLQVWWDTYK
jgi:hypothetical protein